MSEPGAQYSFLPWLRRGVGAEISRVDGGGTAERRHAIPIDVRFNQDAGRRAQLKLELFGPGEVRGFDVRTISRTWPLPGVMDIEPNYFPIIEFDQPDLPWRYTPARPTSQERLTPWVTLIVLADTEIEALIPPKGNIFGSVRIGDTTALPKHGQLWAWAHVQVSGETGVTEARVAELLASRADAHRVVSRIMAPRRLVENRSYTAFLVPSFQRGVLAGLGQDPPDSLDGLEPAWRDTTAGPLTLPVYYLWRFGTGRIGDFEALASQIKAFTTPASIGTRDMDVSTPAAGAPPAHDAPLGMVGMLRGLATPDTNWTGATRRRWISWLKQILNQPVERLLQAGRPRLVTPPLYGQWHAATDRCSADAPNPRPAWFQELSVDPRLRVAAALGTQVVQSNQEALMASAWQQVERIRQLNEELRQAQLAREVAARVAERHVLVADEEVVLSLTAPVATRLKASPRTIRAVLNDSPIPRGIFDGAFRRIARPRGPVARRQKRDGAARGLLDRLNRGVLAAADVPPTPSDLATPSRGGGGLAPGETPATIDARRRRSYWLRVLIILLFIIALLIALFGLFVAAALVGAAAVAAGVAARSGNRATDDLARQAAYRDGTLTGAAIRAAPASASYQPATAPPTGAPSSLPGSAAGQTPGSPVKVAAMREALARVFDRTAAPVAAGPVMVPVSLTTLRDKTVAGLDPRVTITAAYQDRFTLQGVVWGPDDPIEPVMAAPEFPQPMYTEVKKISPEWLLPGFSQIPNNISTLLLSNSRMIEAFMVGLNHEMARELLWREYPTDQRGTYFRQFWDIAGFVPKPGERVDPTKLYDITQIHTWGKSTALGTHTPRPAAPASDYLVLLVRGDLLRRYPNTVVYAARAKWVAGDVREIDDPAPDATPQRIAELQAWPLFSGVLEPDGCFFGFRLTVPQVKGADNPAGDPGWFFVLQEHSSEARFGLDEAAPDQLGIPVAGADWNNLSWGSLVADAAGLAALKNIDLNAELPNTTLVSDPVTKRWHADRGRGEKNSRSSDLAYVTFQRPMRVGIHAADMIP